MRTRRILPAAAILIAFLLAQATTIRADDKADKLTPAEAKAVAQEAYVFGLPLVYIAVQLETQTNVAKPQGGRAPFGQFAHYREFPDAANKQVVGLNVDTLYSFANLDLAAELIVLSVPPMGDRWWLMQIIDAWNDVPAAPGARTVGGEGGNFALVGPNWKGELPDGLKEYRVDTNLCMIGGRTYTAGKADYDAVHKIQDQYKLTPLSKWGTDYTPPATVPIRPGVDAKTPVPTQAFKMPAEQFFNRLSELLVNNPAREADAPIMARIAKLGIVPGAKFKMDAFDADIRKAIDEGVGAGQQAIRDGESKMGEMVNGWQIARDLGRYGTKYTYRATWTFFGVGGNLVEDAIYPLALVDSDGKQLKCGNKYVLHLAKNQIPPVNAFWSLTMYGEDSYLVDNVLNRYSLGDRSKCRFGEDGSLTLYLQNESPGKDKEDNWLPAPKVGAFKLALRLYGPKKEVTTGTWKPPAVERVK
jgi:hypothetical protein